VATVAIKGKLSSSKSLFPKLNQGKHTCLMAKESKRKVKTKGISSPKYISSDDSDDDDAPFPNGLNEEKSYQKAREGIGSSGSTSRGSRGFALARKEKYK
jgi:hypothetical protein